MSETQNIPIGSSVQITKNEEVLYSAGLEALLESPEIFDENFEVTEMIGSWYVLGGNNANVYEVNGFAFPKELLIVQF